MSCFLLLVCWGAVMDWRRRRQWQRQWNPANTEQNPNPVIPRFPLLQYFNRVNDQQQQRPEGFGYMAQEDDDDDFPVIQMEEALREPVRRNRSRTPPRNTNLLLARSSVSTFPQLLKLKQWYDFL